jgi:hypothetical protein
MDSVEAVFAKCRKAIDTKNLLNIFYKSEKDPMPRWREIEPYLIVLVWKQRRIKLVGYPIAKNGTEEEGQLGHYYLDKLEPKKIKVMRKKFIELSVEPVSVFNTPEVTVLHRIQFLDKKGNDRYKTMTVDYDSTLLRQLSILFAANLVSYR